MKKKLLFILLISFLIRLISLNQSLWLDEAVTAKVVTQFSPSEINTLFSPTDFHPPFYYLFMRAWTEVFGNSEFALRMPSVFFSLFAGIVIYQIGRLLKDEETGFWAALFFLFNPLIMYYSQEARMYMMTTIWIAGSIRFYLGVIRLKDNRKLIYCLILLSVLLLLLMNIYYGSIIFMITLLTHLLYKKNYKPFFFLSLIIGLSLLYLSPLLIKQFSNAQQSLQTVQNWDLVLGKATIKNLLLIPIKFSVGRISFEPKILYYALAGIWTATVAFFALKGAHKNRLMAYFFVFPLLLGLIVSFFTPMLQYFRFLYLIVPLSLLLSFGTRTRVQRSVVLAGFSVFSLLYLLVPSFHREDWKSLSARVKKMPYPVYMVLSAGDPLRYYAPDLPIHDINSLKEATLTDKILVIPYVTEIHGIDYRSTLEGKGFTQEETLTEREVTAEVWSKTTL